MQAQYNHMCKSPQYPTDYIIQQAIHTLTEKRTERVSERLLHTSIQFWPIKIFIFSLLFFTTAQLDYVGAYPPIPIWHLSMKDKRGGCPHIHTSIAIAFSSSNHHHHPSMKRRVRWEMKLSVVTYRGGLFAFTGIIKSIKWIRVTQLNGNL